MTSRGDQNAQGQQASRAAGGRPGPPDWGGPAARIAAGPAIGLSVGPAVGTVRGHRHHVAEPGAGDHGRRRHRRGPDRRGGPGTPRRAAPRLLADAGAARQRLRAPPSLLGPVARHAVPAGTARQLPADPAAGLVAARPRAGRAERTAFGAGRRAGGAAGRHDDRDRSSCVAELHRRLAGRYRRGAGRDRPAVGALLRGQRPGRAAAGGCGHGREPPVPGRPAPPDPRDDGRARLVHLVRRHPGRLRAGRRGGRLRHPYSCRRGPGRPGRFGGRARDRGWSTGWAPPGC